MSTVIDMIIRTLDDANRSAYRFIQEHERYKGGHPSYLGFGAARMAKQAAEAYNFLDELLMNLREPGTETRWTAHDESRRDDIGETPIRELIFKEHVVSQYLDIIQVNGSIKVTRTGKDLEVVPYGGSYFNELACEQIKALLLQPYED